jgi:Mn2+/Fe2+ NRAMP family transporter
MPGLVAGAGDLDPAAVLTATVVGATYGLSVAWVVLLSFPVLQSVLAVSARIGQQTRRGLIELVGIRYGSGKAKLMALGMVAVNLLMAVGDIYAVSDAMSLILQQRRFMFMAAISFLVWYLLVFSNYEKVTRKLGLLTLVLLAYILAAHRATPSYLQLGKQVLLPTIQLSSGYLMAVIALFGSLLTPDVIVWQTSTKRDVHSAMLQSHTAESKAGTAVACLISFSAIVCASRLHVSNPEALTTRMAAEALNVLGELGPTIFSIGIIGSGLIALPLIVGSLCFSVAEAFGWRARLSAEPWEDRGFYALISFIVVLSTVIDLFGINVVRVLYLSQLLAGIMTIPILYYMWKLGNDAAMLATVNTPAERRWLMGALLVSVVANLAFLATQLL